MPKDVSERIWNVTRLDGKYTIRSVGSWDLNIFNVLTLCWNLQMNVLNQTVNFSTNSTDLAFTSEPKQRDLEGEADGNGPKPTELQPLSDAAASTQPTPTRPPKLFILDDFLLINLFASLNTNHVTLEITESKQAKRRRRRIRSGEG